MTKKQGGESIVLFENDSVRRVWVEQEEKWYFSVVDVVRALTGSSDARNYWKVLKNRLKEEIQSVTNCNQLNEEDDFQLSTICRQLKFLAKDEKYYLSDAVDTESLLRIIQSIPSPKAESFKRWLAKVGYERIQETENRQLEFHIKSDDYFGNLATSFSIIKQTMGRKNFLYLNIEILNKIESDLLFMQNNYKIMKK